MHQETNRLNSPTENKSAVSRIFHYVYEAGRRAFVYTPRKGKVTLFSIAVLYIVAFQVVISFVWDDANDPTKSASNLSLPIFDTVAEELPASAETVHSSDHSHEEQGVGGPIRDYDLTVPSRSKYKPEKSPNVTVLDPVASEETLVPTGDVGHDALLSGDLESLATNPVVLTKSAVSVNDTLIKIFRRNNLRDRQALALVNTPGAKAVSVLYPNDLFKFVWSNNKLLGVEMRRKNQIELVALYDGAEFSIVNRDKARRAGSLVKLLERELETTEKKDLVNYKAKYAQIKKSDLTWEHVEVTKGDALSKIFKRVGLDGSLAVEIATYPGNEWLTTDLKPGQVLEIAKFSDGKFAMLQVPEYSTVKVRLVFPLEDGYFVGFKQIKTEQQEHYACSTVQNNLYEAARKVNIPNAVVDNFENIFDSRIDFSRQLHPGDEICVIYERNYVKGKPLQDVTVTAASLTQKDVEIMAFRHVDDDNQVSYYDSRGVNMRGHFLRSPIKSARVSSVYSESRYHPILKKRRPHRGVDYGARTGTPIRATANGRVTKRAHYKGYGKMIVLQHGKQYRTVYAHMSRFAEGSNIGNYVKQGQVIGYVGSTGLSTGPHLHYEFHVNGKHRDPLNYDMPSGEPIPDEYQSAFQLQVDELSRRLASIDEPQVEYRPTTVQTASSQ